MGKRDNRKDGSKKLEKRGRQTQYVSSSRSVNVKCIYCGNSAIDPPPTVPFNRDARMEKKLTDSIGIIPTLILSDQERAIKYDSWDSKGKYKSYLAKRIQNKGASTVSLLDYWNNPQCEDIEVFLIKSTEFALYNV